MVGGGDTFPNVELIVNEHFPYIADFHFFKNLKIELFKYPYFLILCGKCAENYQKVNIFHLKIKIVFVNHSKAYNYSKCT